MPVDLASPTVKASVTRSTATTAWAILQVHATMLIDSASLIIEPILESSQRLLHPIDPGIAAAVAYKHFLCQAV